MRWWWLAALALIAEGQQPAAPQQTFRSGTQIVQVDVRVTKDGRFVTDLEPGDFAIKEDGVPQKIESVVLIGGTTSAPVAPLASSSALRATEDKPRAPLAPQAPPQVWVFVFDTEHLSPGGLSRTRDAVVKFIGERFHQGDIGGVLFDGKMANNRLTTDREELRKAAASVKMPGEMRSRQLELREWPRLQDDQEAWMIADGDRQALAAAVTRACSDDPDQCRKVPVDLLLQQKARKLAPETRTATLKTLKSAETLSNGLARMAGAKTVVFLSEGFFLTSQESELRQAVGMASRAGARFYTIDARGLNKGSASADIIDNKFVDNAAGAQQKFDTQADGTNSLAVDTGGFAIRNENNFARALDEIQNDAGTYYVVSYTASNTTFDGKYRAIDVGVTRPGVKVRARRGYLALEPAALLKPSTVSGGAAEPSGASAPRVPPKPVSEGDRAKADVSTPELPVSPGLIALPDAAIPGESVALAASESSTTAVRTRIDGGRLVAELRSSSAGAKSSASFGETTSAVNSPAELGWAAYQKGDVSTAATHLAEAAKAPDARPWVHYALGLAQFAQRRYKEAAAAWERVLRDVPEFEPIYFSLADAYGLQNDEGTAIKVLRDAQGRWPADPEVGNAIGVLQVKRGALDAAIDSFEAATKAAPQDALGYFNLGRALQMRWVKRQRYDREREAWIGPDDDRKRAAAAFQKYLDLGGPYESQARQALVALGWK